MNSSVVTSIDQGRRSGLVRMTMHQFWFDLRALLRNRQAQFFTFALPILFLVIFASIFGGHDHTVAVAGGRIETSVAYVPGIMALGIIAAAFINLVISVTAQRESGILKRRRATPVPAVVLIAGRALSAVVLALTTTLILLVIGWAAFDAHVPARTAPALALTIVVGALVVLLPRLCPRVDHPRPRRCTTRNAGNHAAAVLHLRRVRRRLHNFRAGSSTSPPSFPCATSQPRSSPRTTPTPTEPVSRRSISSSSPPGAPPDCSSRSAASAGRPSARRQPIRRS